MTSSWCLSCVHLCSETTGRDATSRALDSCSSSSPMEPLLTDLAAAQVCQGSEQGRRMQPHLGQQACSPVGQQEDGLGGQAGLVVVPKGHAGLGRVRVQQHRPLG